MATIFVDVAQRLAGDFHPPSPSILTTDAGHQLFYSGELNLVYGDAECGKTWICLAAVAEALDNGSAAAVIDLDHNGADSTLHRLLSLGAEAADLSDIDRFRLYEPLDKVDLDAVVQDLRDWKPELAVLDSLGEAMPLYGASSNSADDFTLVHKDVIKPLTAAGVAVVVVDHLAKNENSRAMGPGGTPAKRRATGGLSVRVTVDRPFTPGCGGSAKLQLNKDRHGGVRRNFSGDAVGDPVIGRFTLTEDEGDLGWSIEAMTAAAAKPTTRAEAQAEKADEDAEALRAMDFDFRTTREVKEALKVGQDRARRALERYRELAAV